MEVPDTLANRTQEAGWKRLRARVSPEAAVEIEGRACDALVGPVSQLGRLISAPGAPRHEGMAVVLLAREIERVPAVEGIIAVRMAGEFRAAQVVSREHQAGMALVALVVVFSEALKRSRVVNVKR